MGTKTKCILLSVITFSFTLLVADFASSNLISHNNLDPNCECPDFSKHGEHPDIHHFVDRVLFTEAKAQPFRLDILKHSLLFSNPEFAESFNSKIWQPPKNS